MKKVIDWFNEVKEPILRKVLLERYDEEYAGDRNAVHIFQAIIRGFQWSKTIEGSDFWDKLHSDEHFDSFYELYPKQLNLKDLGQYEFILVESEEEHKRICEELDKQTGNSTYCETFKHFPHPNSETQAIYYPFDGTRFSDEAHIRTNIPSHIPIFIYPSSYFKSNTIKSKVITRSQLHILYNQYSCNDWRERILSIANKLNLFENEIEVPQDAIDYLLGNGSSEQIKSVEDMLGSLKPKYEFKAGDIVWCKDENKDYWSLHMFLYIDKKSGLYIVDRFSDDIGNTDSEHYKYDECIPFSELKLDLSQYE